MWAACAVALKECLTFLTHRCAHCLSLSLLLSLDLCEIFVKELACLFERNCWL